MEGKYAAGEGPNEIRILSWYVMRQGSMSLSACLELG
jgi:hypothetical protein